MTDLESEFLSVSERRFKKWLMDDVAKYDLFGKLQLKKKCKELSRAWMLSIVYYAPLLPVSSYPGHCLLQQQGERGTGKMAVFVLPSPTGLALKCLLCLSTELYLLPSKKLCDRLLSELISPN